MPKRTKQAKEERPVKEEVEESDSDEEGSEEGSDVDASTMFDPPARGEDKSDEKATEKSEKPAEKPAAKPQEKAKPFSVEFMPHASFPGMNKAEILVYCPTCSLPADFCQYGPSWDKCKPWVMENYPEYCPDLAGASLDDAKQKAEAAEEKSKVKELPGGKKKKDGEPHVSIKKLSRGGRKCVTCVIGLESFGIKLDAAAKLFKKKFACGSSVVKGDVGIPDSVEIQGDFGEEVIEALQAEYKDMDLSHDKFTLSEGGTKKKGKR